MTIKVTDQSKQPVALVEHLMDGRKRISFCDEAAIINITKHQITIKEL